MPKPNFNFQKRQREIAKQKKNEEKRQRKLERSAVKTPTEADLPSGTIAEQANGEAGGENHGG